MLRSLMFVFLVHSSQVGESVIPDLLVQGLGKGGGQEVSVQLH